MTIYESKFQKMSYDNSSKLLMEEFYDESANYESDSYKKDFIDLSEKIFELVDETPKGILVDLRNLQFTIDPDLQKWHNQNIFPNVVKTGLLKMALMLPMDIFAQVGTQQTFDELESGTFETRYFDEPESAKNWLIA